MAMSEDEEMALYQAFLDHPDLRMIAPPVEGIPSVRFRLGDEWRECRIWQGYFDASDILFREMLQNEYRASSLIFPALFNLRHAVEVALKWHIRYAGGTVPKGVGHDLRTMVQIFRATADGLDEENTYIAEYALDRILEFSLIDPHAVTFRYSTQRDGLGIQIAPERWDLCRLYFTAQGLSIWFDGLSDQIIMSQG